MSDCPSCSSGVSVPTAPAFPAFPPPVGASSPSSTPTTPTCDGIPLSVKTLEDFTAPAQGSQVQIYSQCAYRWAVAGMDLFLAPFGRVSIQNVQDDILTAVNRTITPGTTIVAGTAMIPSNGWDFSNATQAVQLLGLNGQGYPVAISPQSENDVIKAIRGDDNILRWQRSVPAVAGMQYYPLATPTVFFTKEDSDGNYTIPGLPSGNVQCVPVITLTARITANNTAWMRRTVSLGGQKIASISGYFASGGEFHQVLTCATLGYGIFLAGNPISIALDDEGLSYFDIDQFDLSVSGWFK